MRNIFRLYNQNRMIIWGVILGIIVIRLILHSLNEQYVSNKNLTTGISNYESNLIYDDDNAQQVESKTNYNKTNVNNNIIDEFFTYCNNNEIEKAYNLLSENCKSELYPNVEYFITGYFNNVFNTKKEYEVSDSISTNMEVITYTLKIKQNMLNTRKC